MSVFAASPGNGPLRQGEILSNVIQIHLRLDDLAPEVNEVSVEERVHPFALILNQDCDLDWDFKARQVGETDVRQQLKIAPGTLFCELMPGETLRPKIKGSDIWKRVLQNQDERYHCFPSIPAANDHAAQGLTSLVADFKRLFTIPTDELYMRLTLGTQRRAMLQGPYLHQLSTRFAYYCMRAALPEDPDAGQVVSEAPPQHAKPEVAALPAPTPQPPAT